MLNRYAQWYAKVTTPGKVFLGAALTVSGATILAEKSIHTFRTAENLRKPSTLQDPHAPAPDASSSSDSIMPLLRKYRYHIVGGTWVVAMAGSLLLSFSNRHMKFSQKLIHARLYAQGLTIAALLATALVTPSPMEERRRLEREARERARIGRPAPAVTRGGGSNTHALRCLGQAAGAPLAKRRATQAGSMAARLASGSGQSSARSTAGAHGSPTASGPS